jgi:hypothetical protein
MTSSFNVNRHDLEYILTQIKIAETHSSNPGMTLVEAIQQYYNISAADAALLPAGLRTVDGSDNNLLPGQEKYGAADTLFPRLLDPVYKNENDETPFQGITNTNYGVGGNVVDSDPRTISNLIVDQTPGNKAAVLAALKVAGYTGNDANAAAAAIVNAHKNISIAFGTDPAVTTARDTRDTEAGELALAVDVRNVAQDALARYTAAAPLSEVAQDAADAALAAVNALIDALGLLPPATSDSGTDALYAEAVQKAN